MSLSIIGAIRMLNNTAKRRIPRASSAENSRLLFLLFLGVVVVGGGDVVVIASYKFAPAAGREVFYGGVGLRKLQVLEELPNKLSPGG